MPYIVAAETAFPGEAAATYDMPIPAGHQSGDLLIAIATQDGGGTNITAAGWTVIGSQAAAQGQRTTALYKWAASGAESDFSGAGATDEWIVTIVVVRGADTTNPINVEDTTNSANSTTAYLDSGTVTTTSDNCLVLHAWGFDGVFKLIPQDPASVVMLGAQTDFVGCVQIVGYKNQLTAGATAVLRALSEVESEGGSALTIAIADATPNTPQLSPMHTQTYQVVKRYGGITSAATNVAAFIRHDAVTWQVATTLAAATINSLTVADIATFAEVTYQANDRPWGSATGLSCTGSATDNTGRWVGATHAIDSTNMTGKIFSLEIILSEVSTARLGAQGACVVFQDSDGDWAAYQLTLRAGVRPNVPYTVHIDLAQATPIGSGGTLNWAAIVRLGYLQHKRTTATNAVILRVKNALLHDKIILVDGCAGAPVSPSVMQQSLDGWGPVGLGSVQGAGQSLIRAGGQYGDGTRKTYVNASATSLELPLSPTASMTRRWWGVKNDATEFRVKASASDTISITACVMATSTRQAWVIDAASSADATYDFSGLSLIGWKVTHSTAGIVINGATIKGCHGVTLNGGSLNLCSVVDSVVSPAVTTNDPELITNCSFISAGTGHAITITAPGTYDFTGNTFTGYGLDGTTNAAIYNNSGGEVVLHIPLGGQIPTVLDGASADTEIVIPAYITIATSGSDTIEMRLDSDDSVLDSRTGAGTIDVGSFLGQEVYFVRVNGGRDIASSSPTTYVLATGDNGTVPLFVGAEVQIGNVDSVAGQVWGYSERTLTSSSGGEGGDSKEDIYTYFTSSGRQDTFKADISGIPTNPLLTNDARLNNLDATIGSRLATSGYTAPPTAAANATAVRSELSTELGRVDAAISTRLATSGYTAPDNASIAEIKSKTDTLVNTDLTGIATSAEVASLNNITASDVVSAMQVVAGDFKADVSGLATQASVDAIPTTPLLAADYTAPDNAAIAVISTGVALMDKVVSNKREVKKVGGEWRLIIYDDDGTTPLRSKALKDFTGAEIADLASGVLAIEEASSV